MLNRTSSQLCGRWYLPRVVEKACTSLQPGKAEELIGEVKAYIKKMQPLKYNLTKEEHKAMEELKKDKTRMILTADKGVSIVEIRMKTPAHKNQQKKKSCMTGNQKQNPYIVVPYYKGLSENLKRTCQKYGVQVYFKGGNTIKSLLMAPNDKDPLMKEWSHL